MDKHLATLKKKIGLGRRSKADQIDEWTTTVRAACYVYASSFMFKADEEEEEEEGKNEWYRKKDEDK